MDSVKCPICTGLFRNLGDRYWPNGDGGNAELVVTCGHCNVDILLRRVVTVAYEAELVPDEPRAGDQWATDAVITDALDYWSDSGATLEDVTALAEWMTARKWSPTGKAEEDLLLVCAGYSDLCVNRYSTAWVSMLAMGEWEDDLAMLLEVVDEAD